MATLFYLGYCRALCSVAMHRYNSHTTSKEIPSYRYYYLLIQGPSGPCYIPVRGHKRYLTIAQIQNEGAQDTAVF